MYTVRGSFSCSKHLLNLSHLAVPSSMDPPLLWQSLHFKPIFPPHRDSRPCLQCYQHGGIYICRSRREAQVGYRNGCVWVIRGSWWEFGRRTDVECDEQVFRLACTYNVIRFVVAFERCEKINKRKQAQNKITIARLEGLAPKFLHAANLRSCLGKLVLRGRLVNIGGV